MSFRRVSELCSHSLHGMQAKQQKIRENFYKIKRLKINFEKTPRLFCPTKSPLKTPFVLTYQSLRCMTNVVLTQTLIG